MSEEASRRALGRAIKAQRMSLFASVDAARIKAGVARGTWEKAEKGQPVRDANLSRIGAVTDLRAAVEPFLNDGATLAWDADTGELTVTADRTHELVETVVPTVGGSTQDAAYVAATGERVEPAVTNDEVLAAVRAMREEQRELLERLERLEQQRP